MNSLSGSNSKNFLNIFKKNYLNNNLSNNDLSIKSIDYFHKYKILNINKRNKESVFFSNFYLNNNNSNFNQTNKLAQKNLFRNKFKLKIKNNSPQNTFYENHSIKLNSLHLKTNYLNNNDDEYLSQILNYQNKNIKNAPKNLFEKYNITSDLEQKEKNSIKKLLKKKKVIIFNEQDIYPNPYYSKKILNINSEICKTLNNLRLKIQLNSFQNKIQEIIKKQKNLQNMSKIKTLKIESLNDKILLNNNLKKIKSLSTNISRRNSSNASLDLIPKDIFNNKNISIYSGIIKANFHPNSRTLFSSCYNNINVYIFGGIQSKLLNDIWKCYLIKHIKKNLNPQLNDKIIHYEIKWIKIKPSDNNLPLPRYSHTMTYYNKKLYIFGGVTHNDSYYLREKNICIFDIIKEQYFYPQCENYQKVLWRRNHIAISVGNCMIVHGGIDDDNNYLNDIWYFDYEKLKWSILYYKTLVNIPAIAYHSCALAIKNKNKLNNDEFNIYKFSDNFNEKKKKQSKTFINGIYIFGGKNQNDEFFTDLLCIEMGNKPVRVIKLNTFGQNPEPRINCGLVFFDVLNILILYGGKNKFGTILNDVYILNLEKYIWIKPKYNDNEFNAVSEHIMFSDNKKIFILGGSGNEGYMKFDFFTIDFDIPNL